MPGFLACWLGVVVGYLGVVDMMGGGLECCRGVVGGRDRWVVVMLWLRGYIRGIL